MRPLRQIPGHSSPQSRPEPVFALWQCDENKGNPMSIIHKRAVAAVVGAFALVTAPAVVDLPGTDAGAAFAKKGGNGNGGGNGRGNGGGNRGGGKGGGGGKHAGAGGSGGGIGVNRGGHWNPKKGSKKKVASSGGTRGKGVGKASTTRSSGGSTQVASARTKTAPAGSTAKRRSVAEVQEMTATSIAPVERPGKAKGGRGALASELKGLNAAHASEQAFANASPNSRVGRIAAYRNAVIGAAGADAALSEAEAALAAFDAQEPEGPAAADIEAQIAELDALGELTPEEEELRASLVEAYDAAIIAEGERAAERQELVDAVETAAAEAESSGGSIDDLFLAASDGRMISPEALAEFHRLLGIEDEFASLQPDEEEAPADEEPVETSGDEGGEDTGEDTGEDDPVTGPVIGEDEPTDVSAPLLPVDEEGDGSL